MYGCAPRHDSAEVCLQHVQNARLRVHGDGDDGFQNWLRKFPDYIVARIQIAPSWQVLTPVGQRRKSKFASQSAPLAANLPKCSPTSFVFCKTTGVAQKP